MNLKEIRELIDILKDTDVSELELEKAGTRIKITKANHGGRPLILEQPAHVYAAHPALPSQAQVQVAQEAAPAARTEDAAAGNIVVVNSPIVGTFYRSASPDAPSYVEVGDMVKKGQVICIIEAMKLMNEIEAEVNGKIVKVLAENAQPVEYGEPLFHIEPV